MDEPNCRALCHGHLQAATYVQPGLWRLAALPRDCYCTFFWPLGMNRMPSLKADCHRMSKHFAWVPMPGAFATQILVTSRRWRLSCLLSTAVTNSQQALWSMGWTRWQRGFAKLSPRVHCAAPSPDHSLCEQYSTGCKLCKSCQNIFLFFKLLRLRFPN